MTPLQIQMLLHFHGCMAPFPNIEYPSQQDALEMFRQAEMITIRLADEGGKYPQGYALTDRGRAFVEAVCSLPFPVKQWVMPEAGASGRLLPTSVWKAAS
jgi:hypothetical protein